MPSHTKNKQHQLISKSVDHTTLNGFSNESIASPMSVNDKDKQIELLTARLTNMETTLNKVLNQLGMVNTQHIPKTNKKVLQHIDLLNLQHSHLGDIPHLVCDEDELVHKVISMNKDQLTQLCQCVLSAQNGEEIEFDESEFTITKRLCSKISERNYGFIQ